MTDAGKISVQQHQSSTYKKSAWNNTNFHALFFWFRNGMDIPQQHGFKRHFMALLHPLFESRGKEKREILAKFAERYACRQKQ